MSYPYDRLWRPQRGPLTSTLVTVKWLVLAGSAVAVNPVRTQAWSPWATSRPTGRLVLRRLVTAERRAASKLVLWTTRYRPSTYRRSPAAQPDGSVPSETGIE